MGEPVGPACVGAILARWRRGSWYAIRRREQAVARLSGGIAPRPDGRMANCLKCNRKVVEAAKFCSYCGEPVAVSCPSCKVLNPPDGLFCHDCGKSMGPGPSSPQHPTHPGPVSTRAAVLPCPRCSAANEPGSTYCYQCGLPIEEEPQAAQGPGDAYPGYTHPYQSPRIRATWTRVLLAATCLATLLHMAMTNGVLDLVSQRDAGQFVTQAQLVEAQEPVDAALVLVVVVQIPAIVLFLMWVHRASRNLPALGAHGQRFSPAWAVGWWFVPIMFLFRPYQVMMEIWRGSDATMPQAWQDGPITALLPWWWILWIASAVAAVLSIFNGEFLSEAYAPTAASLQWELLSGALTICAGVLAILVVRRITSRQDERHLRMKTG